MKNIKFLILQHNKLGFTIVRKKTSPWCQNWETTFKKTFDGFRYFSTQDSFWTKPWISLTKIPGFSPISETPPTLKSCKKISRKNWKFIFYFLKTSRLAASIPAFFEGIRQYYDTVRLQPNLSICALWHSQPYE